MGKRRKVLLVIFLITLCLEMFVLPGMASAEEAYQRKSISYINNLWLATPNARKISREQSAQLLRIIKEKIEMARFDYNPFPDNLVQKFARAAEKEKTLTPERAADILKATVVPTIIEVLNENMEVRAKELVGEAERNSFIALKAKELGLTAEHFEKILNSAYMYIPILTDYSREVSKREVTEDGKTVEKDVATYRLKGGIIWFSLKISDGRGEVEVVKRIEESSSALDIDIGKEARGILQLDIAVESDVKTGTEKVDKSSDPFIRAAESLADKLQVRTMEIPDFTLRTQVMEYSGRRVGFNLGKKEGLFVDQKFRVYEGMEDEHGSYKLDKKGFFMVRRIGDNKTNRNALSYGKPIIGAYDYGMPVKEFPRLFMDIACRISTGWIEIFPGSIGVNSLLSIDEKIDTIFPMANLAIQSNTARLTNIPQLFVTLGGNVGAVPSSGARIRFETEETKEVDFGLYWNLYAGLMKKFYFKRLAFMVEPRYEYQNLTFMSSEKAENKKMNLSYTNSTYLLSATAGIEIALRADVNFGIMAGFRGLGSDVDASRLGEVGKAIESLTGGGTEWEERYSKTEDEVKEVFKESSIGPEIDYSGPFFGIYISYSPATF